MTAAEALQNLLPSYKSYYDLIEENILPPFNAEAKFVQHSEQYFLVKSAKLSDIDSCEHIYFAARTKINLEELKNLCAKAWEDGLKTVTPYYGHRNSDVTVIVLAENTEDELLSQCRKIKYSKTYKFMIYGWSNFKLAVVDLSKQKIATNWHGSEMKSFLKKALKRTGVLNK